MENITFDKNSKSDIVTEDAKFPKLTLVFSETWKIYKNNLRKFVAIALFTLIVYLILRLIALNSDMILEIFGDSSEITVIYILQILSMFAYAGIVIFLVFALVYWQTFSVLYIVKNRDQNPSAIFAIKYSISQTFKAIWTNIVKGVIVFGGNMLAGIPGFIMSIRTIFSDISMVYDKNYGFESLTTSRHYVLGKWWTITFYVLIIGTLLGVIYGMEDIVNLVIEKINIGESLEIVIEHIFIFFYAIISPFALIFLSYIYENLQQTKPAPSLDIVKKDRKTLIWYFISSILATIVLAALFVVIIWYALGSRNINTFNDENNVYSDNSELFTENDLTMNNNYEGFSTIDLDINESIKQISQILEEHKNTYGYYPYKEKINDLIAEKVTMPSACDTINVNSTACEIEYNWISCDKYEITAHYPSGTVKTFSELQK